MTQAVLAKVVSDTPKGCVGFREIKNEFVVKDSLKFANAIFNKWLIKLVKLYKKYVCNSIC